MSVVLLSCNDCNKPETLDLFGTVQFFGENNNFFLPKTRFSSSCMIKYKWVVINEFVS